jgi:hypothetical protein
MRRLALLGLVVVVAALAAGMPDGDNRPWQDGSRHGEWVAVFNGYGEVRTDGDALLMSPQQPADRRNTHAALVVTARPYGDVAISLRLRTERQLRTADPQAWEVGWVLWHYGGEGRFYALALKPNGWELSKQDPRYPGGQRFLASGRTPTFPVGSWHRVGIVQVGNRIDVAADGHHLARYTDRAEPYLTGALGLYTEDARVHFTDIQITPVPTGAA